MSIARPDRAFFLIASAGALLYVSLPRDPTIYDRWSQLFPVAAVIAILVGVARNRPRSWTPWYLVAISGLFGIVADAMYAIDLERYGSVPFPDAADLLALGSNVVLVVALMAMIRRQAPGRDWASLVDAGIVTAGVGIVSWTLLIQPRIADGSSALETSVALSFPVMDVLLVSLAARMVLGQGLRSPAFVMVTIALLFELAGDAFYGFGALHGWYQVGDPLDLFFVFSAILLGTAALHPSMVDLTEPNPDPEKRLTGRRLVVLSAATFMAPAMLAVAAVREGLGELLVIVGAATTLSALVIARLAGLVARHEKAERRESALAESAALLVAAWTPDDIHRVAVDGALRIVDQDGTTVGLVLEGADGGVVGAAGERADELLDRGVEGMLQTGVVTSIPLLVQGERRGALVVSSLEKLTRSARDGVETLAAQVALALACAALAEDLREQQIAERFRSLVQNSTDIIALIEPDLTIRYHTPSVERVLGYGEDALVGKSLADLVDPAERWPLREFVTMVSQTAGSPMPRDLPLRRVNGSLCQLESVFNNLLEDPNVSGIVVTARDVTERRALEEQLAHQAFHDSLTGLANRVLFTDRVSHALERGLRRKNLFAVLFIDLDDFKTVNDSLGHAAGDELLGEVSRRLERSLRPEDTCARLGGDEFAILIESISSPDGAIVVARRVLRAVAEPITVMGSEITVAASVGIALGTGGQSASEIMRSADLAMYRAKSDGKGRFALYEPSMHERVLERLALKADLQRSEIGEDFELHYQPIIALQTGAIVGMEALLRWRHPERGMVEPEEFVAVAEETGLILPIGRWALTTACRDTQRLRAAGHRSLVVNVNISAKQLASRHLPGEVTEALAESGLDPGALTLEITESVLLDSDAVISRLETLKSLGVRIAIDDFGTGYSSLNYLRRFPVDTLKIAKAFIEQLGASPEQERLAAAILRLGSTLELETVAEGVETAAQRDLLRALRCGYAQGFYFSRPVPAPELDLVLRRPLVA